MDKLSHLSRLLKTLGANTFGHLPRRIRILQSNVINLNSTYVNEEILLNIRNLESQLDHLLTLEESYWKQRSRT